MLVGIDGRAANAPNPLGAGVYCHELLKAFSSVDTGFDFRIYLDGEPRAGFPILPPRAEIRVLPPGRLWTLRRLSRELRRDPPSLFFAPVLQTPVGCPCPVVATHHGLYREYDHCLTSQDRKGLWRATRIAKFFASHFIAVSQDAREQLSLLAGIPEKDISFTHHACSPDFQPHGEAGVQEALREKFKLPKRFILFTGRLSPRKNLVRMIEAYGKVCAEFPGLEHDFVIAGTKDAATPSADPVMRAAQAVPDPGRIHFVGHVDREDMPALMREAELLFFVSISESFGIPAIEAMASGTPVLGATTCALPEVLGGAGLLTDPYTVDDIAARLAQVLNNDALRHSLREKGLARARDFSWERTAATTLEIFRQTLGVN